MSIAAEERRRALPAAVWDTMSAYGLMRALYREGVGSLDDVDDARSALLDAVLAAIDAAVLEERQRCETSEAA